MNKRLFDFFGALTLLMPTGLLFLPVALWIKATSPGPVIFRQTRVGLHGKLFTIFKFRTLREGSARPLDTVQCGDKRITAPGRFLRKTHIDELPQLINVLWGQMSLVGPRPKLPDEFKKNAQEIAGYQNRLNARPGLTGLVQLRGRMWTIEYGERGPLRLELFYISHQSFCFDLQILCKTIRTVLGCKGV